MHYNALFRGICPGTCNIMHVASERFSPLIKTDYVCERYARPLVYFYDLLARPSQLRFRTMRTKYSSNARVAFTAALIFTLVGVSLIAPRTSSADEPFAVVIQHGIAIKMRDGVTLRADIYRPKADGKFPVILTRTPYDKTGSLGTCMRVAASGYVCVAQDVRGRFS
jgi:predicted acyl esterase